MIIEKTAAMNRCPCGGPLASLAALAHGVCDRCRITAKKPVPRTRPKPDFEDVALPGLKEWGQ